MASTDRHKASSATDHKSVIDKVLSGKIISSDFFSRHWPWCVLAVCMIMAYISSKYNCQTKMEEIRRLEHELEVVKTERVRERSRYMSRTRESSMNHLVDSLRLDLHVQDTPPFKISPQ